MTKIESRPSKKQNWEYLFFVDIDGIMSGNNVKKAITQIKQNSIEFKSLGSYSQIIK